MTPPDALSEEGHLHLKELAEGCPELGTLAVLVRSFGQMLTRREGHRLAGWLDEVRGSGLRALRVFAEGLIRDQDAVRAGFALLRKRVLLA